MIKNDGNHFLTSVKIGPKGQIVIPKEIRDMFGLECGDTLVIMASKRRGIAMQTVDKLQPMMKKIFYELEKPEAPTEDEE